MDEIDWLEKKIIFSRFDESKFINIYRFLLIWNIFENKCFNNFAQISEVDDLVRNNIPTKNRKTLNEVWDYFHGRYVKNNQVNDVFKNFTFRPNDNKQFVENTLLKSNPSNDEKLKALLRIIFRLRNNLYHGMKEVKILNDQNESFKKANLLLMDIIDNYQP